MNKVIRTWFLGMAVISLLSFISVSSYALSFGSATVDGNPIEWSSTDFFASMHRAGDPDKVIESNLYLRYDCNTQTLYTLVLNVNGIQAITSPNDAYVKFKTDPNGNHSIKGVGGDYPSFAWVASGNTVIGWEGSFQLAPGSYVINAHIQVWDDNAAQTSATTNGSPNDRFIPLTIDCSGVVNPDNLPPPPINTHYSISGFTYIDTNNNGLFDSGETVLSGLPITLNGSQTVNTTNGYYEFTDLLAGNYTVAAPQQVTIDGQDYVLGTLQSLPVSIVNANVVDVNFGYVPVYDITGILFVDSNRSGIIDAGETGVLTGVTITLTDILGNIIAQTISDDTGYYAFENLFEGNYKVSVAPKISLTENTGVVVYKTTAYSTVTLGGLNQDTVVNFGYAPVYNISGVVYLDTNRNGVFDSLEPIFPGITVYLYDSNNNLLASPVTDSNGAYLFEDQWEGVYQVIVGGLPTSIASYFNLTTSSAYAINLTANSSSNNFGLAPNTQSILDDLKSGDPDGDGFTFTGTGKTIGFWKHQLTTALSGKGKAQVNAADLKIFVDNVEAFYLEIPFQFNDVNEFLDALNVLQDTSSNPLDLLKKQLLGTEFNQVSGRGLLSNPTLQTVLLQWGESLVASQSTNAALVISAKDILDAINNTGE